ncbi:MAG: hypothetical protein ACO3F3_17880 [Gemmataceae bacterium]|jgi:hypothetical protein
MNFDTTAILAAVAGAVAGYLFAERSKPREHPLLALVRQKLRDREKQSKEVNVEEELKKLIGG